MYSVIAGSILIWFIVTMVIVYFNNNNNWRGCNSQYAIDAKLERIKKDSIGYGIIATLFLSASIALISFIVRDTNREEYISTKEIYSVNIGSEVNGSFVLGTGSISGTPYY